jgi:hypothetical protein
MINITMTPKAALLVELLIEQRVGLLAPSEAKPLRDVASAIKAERERYALREQAFGR